MISRFFHLCGFRDLFNTIIITVASHVTVWFSCRYWSHVVHCGSCRVAVEGLKALEVSLQVISFASVAVVAAVKQNMMSTVARSVVVCMALVFFLASKWLSHFIYKNFYYHDYNHALK